MEEMRLMMTAAEWLSLSPAWRSRVKEALRPHVGDEGIAAFDKLELATGDLYDNIYGDDIDEV